MSIIVLIPALIAAYVASTQSPHKAFIYVYVPVLLFLPDYYSWSVPGLPDPNFGTATVLAIFGIWMIQGLPGWRFSFTDILVLGYVLTVIYSESLSLEGKPHFQNFTANFIASVLCPYLLAKSLIEPAGLREAFAKSMVITLFLVALLMILQFVTLSPYTLMQRVLGPFFGGQGWRFTGDMRWGLRRVTGPYQHEILSGIIMWTGYRIQRWLQWSQVWPPRFSPLPWLPLSTARLLSLTLFVGAVTSLTRGPMLGALAAAFIPLIGLSKKRWTIFWILLATAIIVGTPTIRWFISYASVDPELAESWAHQTVIYRWQLMVNYLDMGFEKLWGLGRFGTPNVGEAVWQSSIDNYFLTLLLRHGIIATSFFVGIFFTMMIRLFFHAMLQPPADPPGSSLGFTLLSVYILIFVSIATVWLGHQTEPLLFLLFGWSEGYLISKQASFGNKTSTLPKLRQSFKFRRIL